MNKENLIEYVNLYNQFQNNPNMQFTNNQSLLIKKIHEEARINQELANFISKIQISNEQESLAALNEFFNEQELKKQPETEETVIAKTYGIDISNIQHKYLDNGKEIFYFYDVTLGRNVVLENKKEGYSLVEQLKQMQEENEKYRLGTNVQNTNSMLRDQQMKDNVELKMISIYDINEHMNQIQNMEVENKRKLAFLIEKAPTERIDYINIENIFGIDQTGKIVEVKHDKENNKYEIVKPSEANYNENQIATSDQIDNSYSSSNAVQGNYEDIPNIETQEEYEQLSVTIKDQVEVYYNYPELMEILPEEDKKKWKKYVELYKQKLQKEQTQINLQDPPKQKILKKTDRKSGYADVLLLSLITGFLGGVLTTLTTLLFTK